jgi:hypothetical protein
MGMFDSVHTLSQCGQVKCWGRTLADWVIGDSPRLYVALEPDEWRRLGDRDDLPDKGGRTPEQVVEDSDLMSRGRPSDLADYQVMMDEGFLVVRGREWVDWSDDRVDDLPVVDNFGRDLATSGRRVSPGATFPVSECSVCSPSEPFLALPEGNNAALEWLRDAAEEVAMDPDPGDEDRWSR